MAARTPKPPTAADACPDVQLLMGLATGELSAREADALRAHVDACADCCIALARLMASTADGTAGGPGGGTAAGPLGIGAPIRGYNDGPQLGPDLDAIADGIAETIADRYEVGRLIGVGAMGIVAAATDRRLGREVAIKLIRPRGREAAQRSTQRLVAESRAMARLRHPNVVAVFDAGPHEDGAYVAMEYVRGQTLRAWSATARSWQEVLAAFVQAGKGLEAAHREGLVHRDFKPDNVLIDEDGRVQVTDFGLCRTGADDREGEGDGGRDESRDESDTLAADGPLAPSGSTVRSLTETGSLVGTPAYMAPEQHEGTAVDARADIYAFCTALWEGLVGKRPFSGTTLGQLHAAKLRGPPGSMPSDAGVPRWLERAVRSGLHPDAARRPPRWPRCSRSSPCPRFAGAGV